MIEIYDMSFAYSKKQQLFEKLSLQLSPGSITGLLGTNGAGKTTLLKLICGLIRCSQGTIRTAGENPTDRSAELLSDIYFVPEEINLPAIKIENYTKAHYGFYPNFDTEKLNRILTDFELDKSLKIQELSHGQKKKFIVSFALATNCKLLIFDEPTNGLDIPSKSVFRKILAGSVGDDQLVIISTHQVKDIENLIDNIVILQNGMVTFHESIADISEKLVFSSGRIIDETSTLYREQSPGGYKTISKQTNGHASDIDIELLFNAVISGKKLIEHHEN